MITISFHDIRCNWAIMGNHVLSVHILAGSNCWSTLAVEIVLRFSVAEFDHPRSAAKMAMSELARRCFSVQH